jgi:HlyD family secretion protein
LLWIGVPALLIAGYMAYAMTRKQERTFFTSKVDKGDVISIVQATGTINAVTSVLVGSQVSGNIDKLFVDFNSQVKKGQVIAQIEPSLFQTSVDQAKADLANAVANQQAAEVQITVSKADVANSKANIEKAKAACVQSALDLKRAIDLGKQGVVPQQQVDAAQATDDANKAQLSASDALYQESLAKLDAQVAGVDQAKAQVNQKKAALAAAQVNLDHATIFAPINGTVVARSVDVGQTVAAGFSAPTLYTIAEDLSKMLVHVNTDESDVGNVKVGGLATFKVDAFPKDTFNGRIKEVRINPTTVQNVVTYDTVIEFENSDLKLLPGMTAYVTIPVSAAKDVLKIPNGAVRFRPEIPDNEKNALLKAAGINQGGGKNKGLAEGDAPAADAAPPAAPPKAGAPSVAVKPKRGDNEIHVLWKLVGDKQMEPVLVKTGITDYTVTAGLEVLKGSLNAGDNIITGMAIPNRASTGAFGPGGQPGRGGIGAPGGAGRGR